jgi:hypothetical protein
MPNNIRPNTAGRYNNTRRLNAALSRGNYNPLFVEKGTEIRGMLNAKRNANKRFKESQMKAHYGESSGPAWNGEAAIGQQFWHNKAVAHNAAVNAEARRLEALNAGSNASSLGSRGGRTMKKRKNMKKYSRRR